MKYEYIEKCFNEFEVLVNKEVQSSCEEDRKNELYFVLKGLTKNALSGESEFNYSECERSRLRKIERFLRRTKRKGKIKDTDNLKDTVIPKGTDNLKDKNNINISEKKLVYILNVFENSISKFKILEKLVEENSDHPEAYEIISELLFELSESFAFLNESDALPIDKKRTLRQMNRFVNRINKQNKSDLDYLRDNMITDIP